MLLHANPMPSQSNKVNSKASSTRKDRWGNRSHTAYRQGLRGQTARSFYLLKGRFLNPYVKVPKTSSLYCLVPKHLRDTEPSFSQDI